MDAAPARRRRTAPRETVAGQQWLPFGLDELRVEIPAGAASRCTADGRVLRWHWFAHSVDHAWPWWRPGAAWDAEPKE